MKHDVFIERSLWALSYPHVQVQCVHSKGSIKPDIAAAAHVSASCF